MEFKSHAKGLTFESAMLPAVGRLCYFEPPITIEYSAMPNSLTFNDATDVLAALLVGMQGSEKVAAMAHTISVMSQVVPNDEALADYLTGLTGDEHRVTIALPLSGNLL